MRERDFQISFERQLNTFIPQYGNVIKLDSDTIFHYLNIAKNEYVKQVYRAFQYNQELSDKLRTLVNTKKYTHTDFTITDTKEITDYPEDYLFALGERVKIDIKDNKCHNLKVKYSDVIEATIETVDKVLENSLSEYHLHYNQAKPVRVYTDNKIVLYTDGNYNIKEYELTYLRNAKDLGNNLIEEYTDLPEHTHQEIVDAAVTLYVTQLSATNSKDNKSEEK